LRSDNDNISRIFFALVSLKNFLPIYPENWHVVIVKQGLFRGRLPGCAVPIPSRDRKPKLVQIFWLSCLLGYSRRRRCRYAVRRSTISTCKTHIAIKLRVAIARSTSIRRELVVCLPKHAVQLTTRDGDTFANLLVAMRLAFCVRVDKLLVHIHSSKTTILIPQWRASITDKCGRRELP